METEVPAQLEAFGYPACPATAVIIEQTPARRFGHALVGLGMFWGMALLGLFIPVAHFVLVPTFLVAGLVVAALRAREDRWLVLIRGGCPRCGAAQEFAPGGRFHDGRNIDCPKCHGTIVILSTTTAARP